MKVLIADDEPNILLSLEFLMKKAGYEVFIARNGTEALALMDENRPEMVVLDIMMPDVDGLEVCHYIRSQPGGEAVKVIFLSAKSKEADIQKGYEAGADLYITKPFSTRHLMEKIRELTGESSGKPGSFQPKK
jgi:DNA-binding response OmpR family regulator